MDKLKHLVRLSVLPVEVINEVTAASEVNERSKEDADRFDYCDELYPYVFLMYSLVRLTVRMGRIA